jgi:hypothetical protein
VCPYHGNKHKKHPATHSEPQEESNEERSEKFISKGWPAPDKLSPPKNDADTDNDETMK